MPAAPPSPVVAEVLRDRVHGRPTTNTIFPAVRGATFVGTRPIGTLVVDAEEDFDWFKPVYGTEHSVKHMLQVATFQDLAKAYGAVPTYLLTYPVLQVDEVVALLRRVMDRGECDVGIQLHPWVTPPFEPSVEGHAADVGGSFAGNLPPELERRKLFELCRKFKECFGFSPKMYRAGRYGLGQQTAALLEELAFTVDCSLAPRTDFSAQAGPDYTDYKFEPFWFGERQSVLEVPLCREIVGWSGALAPMIYKAATRDVMRKVRADGLLSWVRCAERVTLSPEGNNSRALRRLASHLYAAQSGIFVVSFHSSSLMVGANPYVSSRADVHEFYDRLSSLFSYMVDGLGVKFEKLADVPQFFLDGHA